VCVFGMGFGVEAGVEARFDGGGRGWRSVFLLLLFHLPSTH